MVTHSKTDHNAPANPPPREFLTRSALWFIGAVASAAAGTPRLFAITLFLFASFPSYSQNDRSMQNVLIEPGEKWW